MEILDYLYNNIFSVKELFWYILGIITPYIFKKLKTFSRLIQVRYKIKKNDLSIDELGITSIGHGDPFYIINDGREDIELNVPLEMFRIRFPEEILNLINTYNKDFNNLGIYEDTNQFLGRDDYNDFIRKVSNNLNVNENNFEELLKRKIDEVARVFLHRIQNGEPYFNGELYGIKKINVTRKTINEKPNVNIICYKSDYFTHRLMASIYQESVNQNIFIIPNGVEGGYNDFNYFLTSIGLNLIVLLEDENLVVFTKRSGNLLNMSKDTWHVTMNEAVSVTDLSDTSGRISLERCILRGLNEELGLDLYKGSKYEYDIYYSDIFYVQNPIETGILSFIKIRNLSFDDLQIMYSAAKDKEFETKGIMKVRFSKDDLKKFLKKNEVTHVCQYAIKMLLARDLKKVI